MQVLPEDFPKFCRNLPFYLTQPVISVKELNYMECLQLQKMFGTEAVDFPLGRIGDILLIFQHYDTFNQAVDAWNRRKERIKECDVKYIFIVLEGYMKEAVEFDELHLRDSLILTINWTFEAKYIKSIRVDVPEGKHFMNRDKLKRYYEKNWNVKRWLNNCNTKYEKRGTPKKLV